MEETLIHSYCILSLRSQKHSFQATVALLSGGGVGFGDKLEMIDEQLIRSTCRADGRLLKISKPLGATPLQLRYMAKVFHFISGFINAKYNMEKYISLSEIFLLYHYVYQSYK